MKLKQLPTSPALTFDDVILVPGYSTVKSRKDPKLSPDVSVSAGDMKYKIPILSSPMNTVTEAEMIRTLAFMGGAGVLHRGLTAEQQVAVVQELFEHGIFESDKPLNDFWVAVGAKEDEKRIEKLATLGVHRFCIDVANGQSEICVNAVHALKKICPSAMIMAGNVCTYDGALRLADAGAIAIRVGIGSGSACKTRVVTGHGVPQLTAIEDCSAIRHVHPDICIIADGGLRHSGDIVKAIAAGADMVMLGGLLAGTSDTPGPVMTDPKNGSQYKYYHGMASVEGRSMGDWFDRSEASYVPEGESIKMPFKGETTKVIENLIGGLKTGMCYTGAYDLEELRDKAQWMRVTHAGYIEGTPHGKA